MNYTCRMKILFFTLFLILGFSLAAKSQTASDLGLKPVQVHECTPVKDQYMSATCWSFGSNSFLESEMIRQGREPVDLSEMFTARYSYIRKIYQHLKTGGQSFFTPGGQFHDVMAVVKEWGMVPESVYPGRPGGEAKHNHARLDTLVKRWITEQVARGRKAPDAAGLKYINGLLDTYLGKVPADFLWKGKKYNPQSFAKQVLGFRPDDYVEIVSYTHHSFYTRFILEDKYNWSRDWYYNVPVEDFRKITERALDSNYTICWDGDVTEPGFRYEAGLATLPDSVADMQRERQLSFDDERTTIDHVMHITGRARDAQGRNWFYVKNSWGSQTNNWGGYLFMSEDYYYLKTVALIVHKSAIPPSIRKKMGI